MGPRGAVVSSNGVFSLARTPELRDDATGLGGELRTRLPDGTPVLVRPLRPSDAAELLDGFGHLSDETRRRRFLGAARRLTHEQLRALTNVDGYDHLALGLAVLEGEGPLESLREGHGIAVARSIRDRDEHDLAEYAIVVADAWQRRGAGRLLTRELLRRARLADVVRWRAVMLADNRAVRRLLDGCSRESSRRVLGFGAIEIIYDLCAAAAAS